MEPNWFVAWPVEVAPDFVVPPPPAGVRVFHPDDRHVTAAFLGPCGEVAARRAFDEARGVARPIERATLGEMRALGNPEPPALRAELVPGSPAPVGAELPARPSSLSALVGEGNAELTEVLARYRDHWLGLAGRPPDRYDPLPHCTLARTSRRVTAPQRAAAVAWGLHLSTNGVTIEVRPLALYTWTADRSVRLFRNRPCFARSSFRDRPRLSARSFRIVAGG